MGEVFVFGRDDPARTRFAVSPLWETTAALHVLLEPQQHQYHLPWLDAVRPDLDRLDLRPLLVLLPRTGWTPDFLSPPPPRSPSPRPGGAGHHHCRPPGTGPRQAAGAGRRGGAAVADPARRRTGARRGVAAGGRTRRHRCPARRPAGAMLAAADRTTLATA